MRLGRVLGACAPFPFCSYRFLRLLCLGAVFFLPFRLNIRRATLAPVDIAVSKRFAQSFILCLLS